MGAARLGSWYASDPLLVNKVDQLQSTVDLAVVPPPSLFYGLLSQRFSGTLELEQPGSTPKRRSVHFRGGMPIWTDWEQDGSRLGALVVAQSLASPATVDAAAAKADGGQRIGEVLVADGVLTTEQVTELLRVQCTRRLLELFALTGGSVRLVAGSGTDDTLRSINVLELIHRGVTAHYDLARLRRELGPAWTGSFKATPALARYLGQFKFRSEDGSAVAYLVSGAVASFAELGRMPDATDARVGQLLGILWHCQMIEPTSVGGGDLARLESELAALEAQIEANRDPVSIIGVSNDATTTEIEAAWSQLAARFDPASHAAVDAKLKGRLTRLSESLQEVRAAARRRRLALAEVSGLRLVGEAKYARGMALLGEAVALGVSDPDVDCALLWAQLHVHGRTDADMRKAVIELERTLAAHPEVAAGHYYYGCVLGWLGRPEDSAVSLRRALELNPSLVDAERQLRALSRPGPQVARPAARKRPSAAATLPGPRVTATHELLTPGYRRLYWFAGILLVILIAMNIVLRLDADF